MAFTSIVKRSGEGVPFDREKIVVAIYKAGAATGSHDRDRAERLADQVIESLAATYTGDFPPTVEDIQDVVERTLIRSGHTEIAKAYIVYRYERARLRSLEGSQRLENIPYKAMWQTLDWSVDHGCHTIAGLNRIIEGGELPALIVAADRRYESILDAAAEEILARRAELRFVIVAGPSSSGKTTTMVKLGQRLEAAGLHVIPMPLDNYFFDLELHPKDEFGDYDFETPEALDLNLINEHLAAIDAGRGIEMPVYDFPTGRRLDETVHFEPEPESLVLLDNLHGLYAELTASVPQGRKFKLYIETIAQLKNAEGRYTRWTDIRLLRRMIRDARFRAYTPERTLLHWHYVRRSELKHIIPFQGLADFTVASALAYELPFLKLHLFAELTGFLERWRRDERRLDGYLRARRVHGLLDSITDVEDDSTVPPTSLLREFIGGSAYDLH